MLWSMVNENAVVEKALALLAAQEAGGYGLQANGRCKAGAPVRITAADVVRALGSPYLTRTGSPASAAVEAVNAVLARHFTVVHITRGVGNTYFYSVAL